MRYMVLCRTTKAEGGGHNGYDVAASGRVFATLADAEKHRAGIARSRKPITVAVIRPEDGKDVWFNRHGAEFLYLYEYESPDLGTCVWLLDENDCEVGIRKADFLENFHQHTEEGT